MVFTSGASRATWLALARAWAAGLVSTRASWAAWSSSLAWLASAVAEAEELELAWLVEAEALAALVEAEELAGAAELSSWLEDPQALRVRARAAVQARRPAERLAAELKKDAGVPSVFIVSLKYLVRLAVRGR